LADGDVNKHPSSLEVKDRLQILVLPYQSDKPEGGKLVPIFNPQNEGMMLVNRFGELSYLRVGASSETFGPVLLATAFKLATVNRFQLSRHSEAGPVPDSRLLDGLDVPPRWSTADKGIPKGY
jgi:hypothetical protein